MVKKERLYKLPELFDYKDNMHFSTTIVNFLKNDRKIHVLSSGRNQSDCDKDGGPVCGENGKTYANECKASKKWVIVRNTGKTN